MEASLVKLNRIFTLDAAKDTEVLKFKHALKRYVLINIIVNKQDLVLAKGSALGFEGVGNESRRI